MRKEHFPHMEGGAHDGSFIFAQSLCRSPNMTFLRESTPGGAVGLVTSPSAARVPPLPPPKSPNPPLSHKVSVLRRELDWNRRAAAIRSDVDPKAQWKGLKTTVSMGAALSEASSSPQPGGRRNSSLARSNQRMDRRARRKNLGVRRSVS